MKSIKAKDILMLQVVFFIYSINSVIAKYASLQETFSIPFLILYAAELGVLGVYAILWQQVIKRMELSIAYSNKAVVLLWGMLFGSVLFDEQITLTKVAGILLVIVGIVVLNGKEEVAS